MVHTAVGYARAKNRLGAMACTTSIGPGATNMVTGAAHRDGEPAARAAAAGRHLRLAAPRPRAAAGRASVGRGCIGRTRRSAPCRRTSTGSSGPSRSCRRCLRRCASSPSPAETGRSRSQCPQDTQTEAFDFPDGFLRQARLAHPARAARRRPRCERAIAADPRRQAAAASWPAAASSTRRRPRRSGALRADRDSRRRDAGGQGIAAPTTIRSALGAIGVTGTLAANCLAAEADVVIGIGTRWSDFTTASKTAFRDPACAS